MAQGKYVELQRRLSSEQEAAVSLSKTAATQLEEGYTALQAASLFVWRELTIRRIPPTVGIDLGIGHRRALGHKQVRHRGPLFRGWTLYNSVVLGEQPFAHNPQATMRFTLDGLDGNGRIVHLNTPTYLDGKLPVDGTLPKGLATIPDATSLTYPKSVSEYPTIPRPYFDQARLDAINNGLVALATKHSIDLSHL